MSKTRALFSEEAYDYDTMPIDELFAKALADLDHASALEAYEEITDPLPKSWEEESPSGSTWTLCEGKKFCPPPTHYVPRNVLFVVQNGVRRQVYPDGSRT